MYYVKGVLNQQDGVKRHPESDGCGGSEISAQEETIKPKLHTSKKYDVMDYK